ncbi:MAG: 2-C-methyl-D-erythritol 4-phosphate cytidylyltransferase [Actinomycetia bacterium]|nr:2-C-methyl-D-erythritol 4-phosphate cytidylyltransferase [Actinomycetes bacterium]MCP3910532.1 2-C-methyl-D-erythritol 4-phosphate cytidylyltransferase [Actinomycetes bacterium]MCP4088137.1 2-C-methyl-D-erythritol 4-phosphate cytidylyltransferase [Actinomycetes bacterium]
MTVQAASDAVVDARTWVILVSAGRGTRFGRPKQYLALGPSTVLDVSVDTARAHADGVVLVVAPDRVDEHRADSRLAAVVAGGATRSDSVRAGLAVVPAGVAYVLVHDSARPLASGQVYGRVKEALEAGARGAVPVVPVVDTIRRVGAAVVDRADLRAVQTPQGFPAEVLRAAHAAGGEATDDAGLVEALGHTVVLVEGDPVNRKITTADDLVVARALYDELLDSEGENR